MSKINILIADNDEQYIENICRYFMEAYSEKLNVIEFTNCNLLEKYLSDTSVKIDILLISTEMATERLSLENAKVLIYLTNSRNNDKINGIPTIFKYQSADKIVSHIFEIYSQRSEKEVNINSSKYKSRVVAVYSPIGGSGKSTVAAALSKGLSGAGSKVFYLNMETAATTLSFFECNASYSLSNIFYCIKEKNKNLALKIEAAVNTDSATGVNFFAPAESPLELEELLSDEILMLIDQLKLLGQYDYIVLDMSSSLNKTNTEVLKSSDSIIIVGQNGRIAQNKLRILLREFEIFSQRENINLLEKCIFLLNKSDNTSFTETHEDLGKVIDFKITFPDFGRENIIDVTEKLASYVDKLLSIL